MENSLSLPEEFALLRRCLGSVTDPRCDRGKVHPLDGVLSLTVLALMSGCRDLSSIYRFGQVHPEVLCPLGLRRSPSVATLSRLLSKVSVSEVKKALVTFASELLELRGLDKKMSVSVDGKTCRSVWEGGDQLRLLHLFSHEASMALDQSEIAYHTDEPKAAMEWIEIVSRKFPGLEILTGDAMFADRDLCDAILAQGKDYVVKLKKTNQSYTSR